MSFPVDITSVLTGASVQQLYYWRRTGLLVPEEGRRPQALYSFRDLVALRTMVRLRSEISLQLIRRAFDSLAAMDLTDHPSQYVLASSGGSIVLVQEDRHVDLVQHPGQDALTSLSDVFAPFVNLQGRRVASFTTPRPHLEVRERRMGGWPTIEGTRIPYDQIAELVADGSVAAADVPHFYPTVSEGAVHDAVSFADEVGSARKAAVA